jgi:hypothetical protein
MQQTIPETTRHQLLRLRDLERELATQGFLFHRQNGRTGSTEGATAACSRSRVMGHATCSVAASSIT